MVTTAPNDDVMIRLSASLFFSLRFISSVFEPVNEYLKLKNDFNEFWPWL